MNNINKTQAEALVQKDIDDNNYPCTINTVTKYTMHCEWCANKETYYSISVNRNRNAPHFTRGHCNSGVTDVSQNPNSKFSRQSEWFVCGEDDCSNGD